MAEQLAQLHERIRALESGHEPEVQPIQLAACYTTSEKPEIGRQLSTPCTVSLPNSTSIRASNLIDTGSAAEGIVDSQFVKQHSLQAIPLARPCQLRLADGTISDAKGTHAALVKINHSGHRSEVWCIVLDIRNYDIILGTPWLYNHNPLIDHRQQSLTFQIEECLASCNYLCQPITHYRKKADAIEAKERKEAAKKKHLQQFDIAEVSAEVFDAMSRRSKNRVAALYAEDFEQLDRPPDHDIAHAYQTIFPSAAGILPEDYTKFYDKLSKKPSSIEELRDQLPPDYREYTDLFDPQEAGKLPPRREVDHAIELEPGAKPPARRLLGCSREQAQVVKAYVDDLLSRGYVRRSTSNYAAPCLVVKKPEGGLRVCVDYRGLNAITKKNRNAPPLVKETLARLSRAKIFTKLDIIAAFNKIRIKEGDEEKTAFLTRFGLFEYLVMPFGLCNAPGTFQSYINHLLQPYLEDFVTAYLDDILIYTEEGEDHQKHVRMVLEKLRQAGLYVDIKKCEFNVKRVKYLGLIVTTEGIEMDPAKVDTVKNWPQPRNLRDVQSFLGFANFYRRFITGYSKLAAPLTALAKKDCQMNYPWKEHSKEDMAFQMLKSAFASAPTLAHFDPDRETWLETDASDYVVAAVLSQRGPDGIIRPVAFLSKKMSSPECNYEIYDKELLAIVRAFEDWRPELAGTESPINVITDHKNLEYFMTTKDLNRRQARWAEFLSEFNFKITYRPGRQGTKPDSLTRRTADLPANKSDERRVYQQQIMLKSKNLDEGVRNAVGLAPILLGECRLTLVDAMAMMYDINEQEVQPDPDEEGDTPQPPDLISKLRQAYSSDETLQRIMQAKERGDRRIPMELIRENKIRLDLSDCTIHDGLLYVGGRIYVPQNDDIILQILQSNHDIPVAGHGGRASTFERVSQHWYWPGMTNSVARYVSACHQCHATKASREGKHGLLKPLPIADRYWNDISVDFITPLPVCHRYGCDYRHIMVVVDRLSKKKKFIGLASLEVEDVVQAFLHYVWREEGYPRSVVSDRGTQFTSKFWNRLCNRIGTKPKLSTAFHPETDGQTESANHTLKAYLRAYINWTQNDWWDWLPLAEFEANSDINASTGVSPFLATKGYNPRSGTEPDLPQSNDRDTSAADKLVGKIEDLRKHVRAQLAWARAKYEEYANQNRLPFEFREGDQVWLDGRFLPSQRPSQSLDFKQYGPFPIVRNIRNTAFELDLSSAPALQGVFPVFHPWLLHLHHREPLPGQNTEPVAPEEPTEEDRVQGLRYEATGVVDSRVDGRRVDPTTGKKWKDPKTKKKGCLMYKITYAGWDEWNQSPEWQPYTDAAGCPNLVATFHSQNPNKPGPHESFASADREATLDALLLHSVRTR